MTTKPTTASAADFESAFATDEAKEKDGANLYFGKTITQVARAGGANVEFAKFWEELTRPYKRMLSAGMELPEDVAKELAFSAFASLVKGWNAVDDDGAPLPCIAANVVSKFTAHEEYFREVCAFAQNLANYRKAVLAVESGN